MSFDELKAILDKVRDESLEPINNDDPLLALVRINNEGVNHGVRRMYYRILTELYKAETERLKAVSDAREKGALI